MGVRLASSSNTALVNTVITGNTSTVGLVTGLIGLVQDNAQINISWYALLLVAAGITTLSVTVRRGSAANSALVNLNQAYTVVAGNQVLISGCYVDTPGIVGQVQYNMTLNPAGAAANSTLLDGCITAMIL